MRAILIVAAIAVLLGPSHARADQNCRTADEVIGYFEARDSTIWHAAISYATVAFGSQTSDKVLVVEFGIADRCMKSSKILTREEFKAWRDQDGAHQ